jgi:hypothetical protein
MRILNERTPFGACFMYVVTVIVCSSSIYLYRDITICASDVDVEPSQVNSFYENAGIQHSASRCVEHSSYS